MAERRVYVAKLFPTSEAVNKALRALTTDADEAIADATTANFSRLFTVDL